MIIRSAISSNACSGSSRRTPRSSRGLAGLPWVITPPPLVAPRSAQPSDRSVSAPVRTHCVGISAGHLTPVLVAASGDLLALGRETTSASWHQTLTPPLFVVAPHPPRPRLVSPVTLLLRARPGDRSSSSRIAIGQPRPFGPASTPNICNSEIPRHRHRVFVARTRRRIRTWPRKATSNLPIGDWW